MINSNNLIDKGERRFQNLAFLTILVIYLLILAGGIVRSTGSGMGCPDWPKCFGQWVPPTEITQLPPNYQQIYGAKLKGEIEFNPVKTWIEYINRLLGVVSGFLVFATLLASLPYLRKDKPVFWASVAAFLLIGTNGWLGSRVVATELAQYMVTLHMLLAILVVFALIFAFVRSQKTIITVPSTTKMGMLSGLLAGTMMLTMGQVLLGTAVRETLDAVIHRLGYAQRESWISSLDWRFYVHRSFSLVVLAIHLTIIYKLNKLPKTGLLTRLTTLLVGIIVTEIATGIVMAYLGVPAFAQPIHLVLAVLMIGLQFVVWLLVTPGLVETKQHLTSSRLQNV